MPQRGSRPAQHRDLTGETGPLPASEVIHPPNANQGDSLHFSYQGREKMKFSLHEGF